MKLYDINCLSDMLTCASRACSNSSIINCIMFLSYFNFDAAIIYSEKIIFSAEYCV